MKKYILTIISIASAIVGCAQSFPFPMNENNYAYPYGIAATEDNAKIQEVFEKWDNTMYRESSDGQYGRIRFDSEEYTVSEGIGYGMLIYVYMANDVNVLCQDRFDKLYAYYKKWSNAKGLMNWKITGFESVSNGGAATDADLDVALALCLAAKQWGSSDDFNYAEEAETILKSIYTYEVATKNGLSLFKPGDSWDSRGNACYFTVASVGVFIQAQKELGFTETFDWEKVYEDSHTYLELCQKNGLWPDWSNWNGSVYKADSDYGWDACRTPWRIAWDYVWFGNESSKSMMDKTIEFMQQKEIINMPGAASSYDNITASSYSDITNGSAGGKGNSAFSGAFGCALTVDEAQQENLDTYFTYVKNRKENPYYPPTLQVLYLLEMSGNAANFFELDGGAEATIINPYITAATTNGNTLSITCSKLMAKTNDVSGFTLYRNGEEVADAFSAITTDRNTITLTLDTELSAGEILSLSYTGTGITSEQGATLNNAIKIATTNTIYTIGGSTMLADCENLATTNLGGNWYSYSDGTTKGSYAMEDGGANGTDSAAHFIYSNFTSYTGVGFNNLPQERSYDCSGSTGLSFYHKGSATTMEVKSAAMRNNGYTYQTYNIEEHEDWTLIEMTWDDLADAGGYNFVSANLIADFTGVQWHAVTTEGEFWIDEVSLIGRSIEPETINREALATSITSANIVYGKITEDAYPEDAVEVFIQAITDATIARETVETTQEAIDKADSTLQAAITIFKNSAYADKTKLANLIEKTTELLNAAAIGENDGEYPETAKLALEEAIASAQEVYEKEGLTVPESNEAIQTLHKAMTTFKKAVIKTSICTMSIRFSLYPNPCTDVIYVNAEEEINVIYLIAMNGTTITIPVHQQSAQIQTSELAQGVYTIIVVSKTGQTSSQFIKK